MATKNLSSWEFDQNANEALKAARNRPVFISDRGRPTHVLLSIEEYRRITGGRLKIADMLAMPGIEGADLEIPQLRDFPGPANLS